MSALASRQIELLKKIDDEMLYWLDGVVGNMHVGGVGETLAHFRKGREPNRPPCVTLEPCRNGQLMLGLVVSRPKNGKFVYDTVLGRWDLSVPIRPYGPLNELKRRHRRVATWGLQLLRALVDFGYRARRGDAQVGELVMPRVLIPFPSGQEKIVGDTRHMPNTVLIDYQSVPGKTLVDSRAAEPAAVAKAIDDDSALEDFRPVLGQTVPNPFRHAAKTFSFAALTQLRAGASDEVMQAARKFIGRSVESGATDEDIVSAAADPQQPMYLSRFSKIQITAVERLVEPTAPYAGRLLPAPNWREQKTHEFALGG